MRTRTISFASRKAQRVTVAIVAAVLAVAAIHPAVAQVNHNSNNAPIQSPGTTTESTPRTDTEQSKRFRRGFAGANRTLRVPHYDKDRQ
jgi:hypothetical protein